MNTVIANQTVYKPSKVVCIGRNYVEHIQELNNEIPSEPVIFLKPNSAITHKLALCGNDAIHYEAELCFLIENQQLVAVGFGLDLTKRELQTRLKQKGLPWERSKAFDGSAVLSEFVPIQPPANDLNFTLHINEQLIQQGSIDLMMYKPEPLLEEVSKFITCIDGDILMTGTPKGVGVINKNDVFKGHIYNGSTCILSCEFIAQ